MDFAEVQRIWARQAEVQDDFERLEKAGPLLEGWTGIRWDDGDIVAVVTDPDRDEPGLLALVDHPDRIRVERAPYSRRELDAVWRELRTIADQRDDVERQPWHSMGPGFERVTIGLQAAEHVLAAQLHERFGDLLEIRLGALPYPLVTDAPRHRIELPKPTLDPPDLELLPEPDEPTYRPGETIHGDLRIVNHGPHRIVIDAFVWATGHVVDETDAVVGVFVGTRAGLDDLPSSSNPVPAPPLTSSAARAARTPTSDPPSHPATTASSSPSRLSSARARTAREASLHPPPYRSQSETETPTQTSAVSIS